MPVDVRLQSDCRAPTLPAALRHGQRGAPVRLPVARFRLRPARRASPAAARGCSGWTPARRRSRSERDRRGLEIDLVTHDAQSSSACCSRRTATCWNSCFAARCPHDAGTRRAEGAVPQLLTRHHSHHYLGFAETQWRLFQKDPPPRVKPLLYVYRVLLTGIHLMQAGTIEANLVHLNELISIALSA